MANSTNFTTLSIRRTKAEWKILEQKVNDSIHEDLGHLLRAEIKIFLEEYEKCPDCKCKANGRRTAKRPSVFTRQVNKLREIGKTMGLSPSKVVDRFIIESLLSEKD